MSSLSISPCNNHEVTPRIVYTEYCICWVLYHPKINCLPLPASVTSLISYLASLGGQCYPQLSTSPPFRPITWIKSQVPSYHHPDIPHADQPPTSPSPISIDHRLQVHLQSRSILDCEFARLRPPSLHPNSLDYGLQVCMIIATKCISKLAWIRPPSASLSYWM